MSAKISKPPRSIIFSILVPVYNEEETLDAFFARMDPVVSQIQSEFTFEVELVFTDNASEDGTYEKILEKAETRPFVKVYRFSKNFGFQRSILTGYTLTNGAACVQIDCDLEDPPELILEFIRKWQEGYKVVYGQRRRREESFFMHSLRTIFYKIVNFLSEAEIPEHAGDFRLIDRRVIDIISRVNDAEPYLRGLIANLGFRQIGVPYDRSSRVGGKSSFDLRSYAALATEGILQSSIKPLNLALYLTCFVFLISISLGMYYLISALTGQIPENAAGFATIIIVSLLQFNFLLLVIGINSLYLGRIYRQVFKRPISITEHTNALSEKDVDNLTYWPAEPISRAEHQKFLHEK